MKIIFTTLIALLMSSHSVLAQSNLSLLNEFTNLYKAELGDATACESNTANEYKVCSKALKNEGNSPYILHHGKNTDKTVVLFHGLSDSPFFFRSIAKPIYEQGHTVVVGLLPGHGKLDADADMEDPELADRWQQHVSQVMALAAKLDSKVYIGGFSTGGALATQYVLANPQAIDGLMLFSGALALDESVESMAKIWGMGFITRWMDGDYETMGPNPYKYPNVAAHSALMLTDVIFAIREQIEQGNKPNTPMFVAHSMADTTTPWRGVEALLGENNGPETVFKIALSDDVCHADLVVNDTQLVEMQFDESKLEEPEKCWIPQANPKHAEMIESMMTFLQQH